MKKSYTLGFTLIELLVVISIIGLLVGVSLFALSNSFQAARDSQRKSDLKQYQTALENYANKNNSLYFSIIDDLALTEDSVLCTAIGQTKCPTDPTPSYYYAYSSNGTGLETATATQYVLWALLEDPLSPVTYWVVCSNGKSGTSTTSPADSSGACPLP